MKLNYKKISLFIITIGIVLNINQITYANILQGRDSFYNYRINPYNNITYNINTKKTNLYKYHTDAWNYTLDRFGHIPGSGIKFNQVADIDEATIQMTSCNSSKEEWLGLSTTWYNNRVKYDEVVKTEVQLNKYTISQYNLSKEHINQVALHEVGHSFGLKHQPQKYKEESIMVPYVIVDEPAYPYLKPIDQYNIASAYPVIVQSDWENHWAKNEIQSAMNKDWVDTTETFRPYEPITRSEFVKVFNRVFGLTSKSGKIFNDTLGHWAQIEIDIAVTNGVCKGISDTEFSPNANITREQAAKMIANYMNISDVEHDNMQMYPDYNKVSDWAKDGLESAINYGYIKGCSDGTLSPLKQLTRAEAVVMLDRIK